jgi:RNA polymerase sigma-70 factor (ECF subfamily)
MAWAGEELIRRMAEGDADACGGFYDRYARLVYPLILRIVQDAADAADVLQDVFWEAWQAAASYDPTRGSPEAWIVMRARTRAIDRVRALRRRSETFVAPVDESLAAAAPERGGDASERAAARATVTAVLDRLPEHQREVIELAYYGGLTQTEIAERLKQPLGTVKTRMRLGLERLRELTKPAT